VGGGRNSREHVAVVYLGVWLWLPQCCLSHFPDRSMSRRRVTDLVHGEA
jgi:hypothetical protein